VKGGLGDRKRQLRNFPIVASLSNTRAQFEYVRDRRVRNLFGGWWAQAVKMWSRMELLERLRGKSFPHIQLRGGGGGFFGV